MTIKGWGVQIIIPEISSIDPIGRAESVDIDIAYGSRQEFEIGESKPVLLQTPYRISGTIRRLYFDKQLFNFVLDSEGNLKDLFNRFELRAKMVTPEPDEGKIIIVKNCLPDSSSIDIRQDDFVVHELDFVADTFEIKESV